MMMMRQSLQLSQKLEQKLSQAMSLAQKLSIRMSILEALHAGEPVNFRPKAVCTGCSYELEPHEILRGFLRDPNDTTTRCPKDYCGKRFQPVLYSRLSDATRMEVPFYCAVQTTEALNDRDVRSTPLELKKSKPAVYFSALFHYGNLKAAFEKKGWDYEFDNFHGWEDKVAPFLGKATDRLVAEVVGVRLHKVMTLRKKLGIKVWKGQPENDDE
jgi:hypothetical protein